MNTRNLAALAQYHALMKRVYWLYNHLRNLDYLSLLGCKITSLDNIKEESKILEYAAQNNYNSWEYGGRFYITVGKVNVFTFHNCDV
jgi:hypothetical protein